MRFHRYRLRRRIIIIAGALILAGLVFADRNGWLLVHQADDMSAYHGMKARAVRVIDGDTIEVSIADALNRKPATRVHLWGVDCPELARPTGEPWAEEASACTRSLVTDIEFTLWLESHQTRDAYGAVLARLELPDGRIVNEVVLEQGLARADDRFPHAYLTRYAQLENSARRRRVGIWSNGRTSQ